MKCVSLLGLAACVSQTGSNNQLVADRKVVQGMREELGQRPRSLALLETSAGVYKFKGVSRDPAKNFCRAVVSNLESGYNPMLSGATKFGKTSRTSCAKDAEGDAIMVEDECLKGYVPNAAGKGRFMACKYQGSICEDGLEHHCTWTYLMEDLISKQTDHASACHGKMLEAKRSLDGLLYDAESILRRIRIQNDRIYAQNVTIRDLLRDQKTYWDTYMTTQEECYRTANITETNELSILDGELDQLNSLVNVIRSDVDFVRDSSYGAHSDDKNLALNAPPTSTSMVELDAEACAKLEALAKKHGDDPFAGMNCHQEREELQRVINATAETIRELRDDKRQENTEYYSECLSEATFTYKFAIESRDCDTSPCVDRRIQISAMEIHDAQNVIATWEPRMHDVEHAAERLRSYLEQLNSTCALDELVDGDLRKVQEAIRELAECPGRNDFDLKIPHWNGDDTADPTPNPTPWYDRYDTDLQHQTIGVQYGNTQLDDQITAPTRIPGHVAELNTDGLQNA